MKAAHALLTSVLGFALSCAPESAHANQLDPSAVTQKGIELFESENYEQAMEQFWKALYREPDSLSVNKWMAKTAFAGQDFEEALFAYQRALVLDENDFEARLGKAKTHQALGAADEARRELEFVVERCLDPKILMECSRVLAELDTKQRHFFHGSLTFTHTFDSNANTGTSHGIVDPFNVNHVNQPTGRSDRVYSLVGMLTHKYDTSIESLFWKNTALFNLREYDRVDALDMILFKLLTGFDYVTLPWIFSIDGAHARTYMDYKLNKHQWELGGAVSRKIGKKLILRTRARHSQRHHFHNTVGHDNTHGHVHYLSLDGTYRCNPEHTLVAETAFRFSKAPATASTDSSYYQLRGRCTWLWQPHPRITTDLTGIIRSDWYQETHPVYSDRKRCDLAITARGSVSFKIVDCLLFVIDGEWIYNDSNVPTSEYKAGRFGTGLRGIF